MAKHTEDEVFELVDSISNQVDALYGCFETIDTINVKAKLILDRVKTLISWTEKN